LGDCILLAPLAGYLKKNGAEEIVVVTKNEYAEVFEAAEGVDRVVRFDPGSGLRGLTRIAARFRGRGYTIIDAHNNLRSRVLCALTGRAAGRFRKYYRERLGLILFKKRARIPSILASYGRLAGAAGFPAAGLTPGGITVPEEFDIQAGEKLGIDGKKYIAIAPGAKWPMKRWNEKKFLELSRRLVEDHGFRLVLLGGENDLGPSTRIENELGKRCVNVTGRTSIMGSAAYIRRCELFVGNDSGLMHLAEAVGRPVVAVFGPTVEAFGYYPALPLSRAIEMDLECRPCSRNGRRDCPVGTHECICGIEVDNVESAVVNLLEDLGSL
jgi:heptosyltransferase-2